MTLPDGFRWQPASLDREAQALFLEFYPRIHAEYERIGLTLEDLGEMGSGGPITRERCEAELARLRAVPSAIGGAAYFALMGVDIVAQRRELAEATRRGGPDES